MNKITKILNKLNEGTVLFIKDLPFDIQEVSSERFKQDVINRVNKVNKRLDAGDVDLELFYKAIDKVFGITLMVKDRLEAEQFYKTFGSLKIEIGGIDVESPFQLRFRIPKSGLSLSPKDMINLSKVSITVNCYDDGEGGVIVNLFNPSRFY